MLNLETILKNFFAGKEISDDHLKQFTEDHLQRLVSNNGSGLFTQILTNIQNNYNGYFGNIVSEDINTAVRKSLTMSADNLIDTFKKTMSQKEGTIRGLYAVDSPTYQKFFPQGLTEYGNANKANIETLMNRMLASSIAHEADLGQAFVQLFTNLRDNYVIARTHQLEKKGDVSAKKTDVKISRTALELQLTANIHYIGYNFPGNVAKGISFFDQSIIRRSQHGASDGLGRLTGIVTNAVTKAPEQNAEIEIIGAGINKAHTNATGKFRANNMPIGRQQARISKFGFKAETVSIEIIDSGDTALNVELQPE